MMGIGILLATISRQKLWLVTFSHIASNIRCRTRLEKRTTRVAGLRKFQSFLDKGQLRWLALFFIGTLIAGLLEMIGLGAIPTFVSLLIEPTNLLSGIHDGLIADWIRENNQSILVLYGAGLLATFFLLKNSYIASLIYAETRLSASITATVSKRLFQGYLYSPYTFHLQRNPADLVRNITEEAVRSVDFFKASVRLL